MLQNGSKVHENPSKIQPKSIKIHPKSIPGTRPRKNKKKVRKSDVPACCPDYRFWTKNPYESVAHVKDDLNLGQEKTLAQDIESWQSFHIFKNRFDVKNIYKNCFLNDLERAFEIDDYEWAKTIHNIWLQKNKV